jgi:hypothetical protein
VGSRDGARDTQAGDAMIAHCWGDQFGALGAGILYGLTGLCVVAGAFMARRDIRGKRDPDRRSTS